MTLKEEIDKLTKMCHKLNNSHETLREEIRNLKGFMVESELTMMRNMQDLHNRLNYIKTYIGVDAFFEACRDSNVDGRQKHNGS